MAHRVLTTDFGLAPRPYYDPLSEVRRAMIHGRRRLVGADSDGCKYYVVYDGWIEYSVVMQHGKILRASTKVEIPEYLTRPKFIGYASPVDLAPRKIDRSRWPRISVALTGDLWDEEGTIHAAYHDRRTRKLLYKLDHHVTWEVINPYGDGASVINIVIDNGLQDAALTEAVEHFFMSEVSRVW